MPSQREDCLFCGLVAEGDHVATADGFVAIRDINPLSETHLLVLPERHIDTFKDIDAFRAGGREEQAEDEEYELEVLEEFMPEPLSEEEVEEIIDDVISEVGATSIRDLGRVMAGVMHRVSGRADGSTVSQLVKEKLA